VTQQPITERSVTHATFVIERNYDALPARVFTAWADPSIKKRWFGAADAAETDYFELDFRVGGRERESGRLEKGGATHVYDAIYQDIVPDERIVYSYDMHIDDKRISVSLATVEFKPSGGGTRLVFTEQGAYLDGFDDPALREEGTRELLDALDADLRRQSDALTEHLEAGE
jgi:uncharacterized protein YndB with AHSA1/START domain